MPPGAFKQILRQKERVERQPLEKREDPVEQ